MCFRELLLRSLVSSRINSRKLGCFCEEHERFWKGRVLRGKWRILGNGIMKQSNSIHIVSVCSPPWPRCLDCSGSPSSLGNRKIDFGDSPGRNLADIVTRRMLNKYTSHKSHGVALRQDVGSAEIIVIGKCTDSAQRPTMRRCL